MPATISVNFLTVVHKDSSGVSMIFPDVCKTPSPAGPVPIPYPNVAMSKDTAAGSSTVSMDGNPIMIKSSYYAMSTGDEAGSAMGVVSSKIKGKAYPKLYSFDVKVDGENVFRLTDIMLQNGGSPTNTPPGTNVQPPAPVPPSTQKDPEVPEVIKMKWEKDKAACGDVVKLEIETKNFTASEIPVNALRARPHDNPDHKMNAWFKVPISGDKGTFPWATRRGQYARTLKITGEQQFFKGEKTTSNELELKTAPDTKESINTNVTTPRYTQQVVAGAQVWLPSGGNYGWSVAYDIEIYAGRFWITRKIDFKNIAGASASNKQKKKWKKGIEAIWDKKFKIHRKDCYRGDTCDCYAEQGCCSYAIRIFCEFAAGQGKQVELHPGANAASGWGTPLWWYSHTWWEEAAGVPADVRAHEFGHQIGMYDEYPAGACDPLRLYTNDTTSIMNAGSTVYDRHFKDFHAWFKSKAGGELGDTKLVRI
jgi:Domain of unknown function (DUF4150)